MAKYAVMPEADYQDACDAVREKTGRAEAIKSGDLGAQIRNINSREPYDGPYEVIPKADEAQTLPTKQKILMEDVTVLAVPYFETDNRIGTTIYIASEV